MVQKAKQAVEESWSRIKPMLHAASGTGNGGKVTARDGGNIMMVMAPASIIGTFVCHRAAHLLGTELPQEVAGALGALIGYTIARKFQY